MASLPYNLLHVHVAVVIILVWCFYPPQSYPVMSETPHESLLLKLQRNEGAVGKRGTVDKASRLRDIIAKTKDVTQPQK